MSKFEERTVKSIGFKDVLAVATQADSAIKDLHRATLAACINNVDDTMSQVKAMFAKDGAHYKKRQVLSNARYLAQLWADGEKVFLDKEGKNTLAASKLKTINDIPSNIDALRKYNKALRAETSSKSEIAEDTLNSSPDAETEPQAEVTPQELIVSLFAELLESDFDSATNTVNSLFEMHAAVEQQASDILKTA